MCPIRAVGLDACKGGWVAVTLEGGRFTAAAVVENLEDFLGGVDAGAVGIDIPIGLPAVGPRAADLGARNFLGNKRSSVFLAPPREALECADHAAATALCTRLTGKGMSRQSFGLKTKILEADKAYRSYPILHEVHPEVSFKAMAGRDLAYGKKTWNGLMERLELLAEVGIDLARGACLNGPAAPDDVVDAAAAAWSANRIALGQASTFPEMPSEVYLGNPVAIWF